MSARTYVGNLYIWEGDTSALLTSDTDQPLVGTFELWAKERVTKSGTKYTGGPLTAGEGAGGPCAITVGEWVDTQHGRRRVCKLTLDGTQTAKCWIQLGYAKEGLVMTKLETDAERTERHAITNADAGNQWDPRGNPILKGSPQRRADATRRVKASRSKYLPKPAPPIRRESDQGGSGPITDADIPFAS